MYTHLVNCNPLFVPQLTTRVDLNRYSDKIIQAADRFECWFNDKLVGLVAIYLNDSARKIAYITNVSVEREHMGKGLAKQLVLQSIERAVKLSFEHVHLEVSGTNHAALGLYKSLGFKIMEETTVETYKLGLEIKYR